MSSALPRRARRALAAALTFAVAGSTAALVAAPPADAATTTLYVVGTSDVKDSNLMDGLIIPGFQSLYPQYQISYKSEGTGAALTDARGGNAAAAIVHSASLENQFVADGYSTEQYGRLLFWGDYVLLGPKSDPAGVLSGAPHDVASAFEKVAAAGAAGTANFVARGGTPGTATQEHAIWKLTSGVSTCTLTSADGGGSRPSKAGGACASRDDTTDLPSWYHLGDSASQANNVNIANSCNFSGGNCYVFTDRGTFKYLQSQGQATNLQIVTRDNAATARGGREALVNVFHAYAVNPAKFTTANRTDATGAKLFLDYLTSTATQQAIGNFLASDGDSAFVPAAAPTNDVSVKKDQVTEGRKTKITGTIANAVPGYPALGGVQVGLLQAAGGSPLAIPKRVATATTDATGKYTFKVKLKAGRDYRVSTPDFAKVENTTLNPVFGSLLTASSTSLGTVSGYQLKPVKRLSGGRFVVSGKLKSKSDGKGKITVLAGKGQGKLKQVGKVKLKDGQSRFAFHGELAPGTYKVQLVFSDKGDTIPTASKKLTIKTTKTTR